MRTGLRITGLVACMILLMNLTTVASTPPMISYQGVLWDSLGNPVNGTVNLAFSIYDDSSGGSQPVGRSSPGCD